ncbi:hypothetical protein Goklo_027658 [Gossypium klotzschianum]|uniref:Uncharacterized protein n=1 Tax=Gossypium klotzschianum TaxID=34286 RepID=A0A7J8TYP2_9ROSI|nr:hypothetical protein [Gossypium klotzschianum]
MAETLAKQSPMGKSVVEAVFVC